jgi:hypothetical protein
MVVGGDLAFPEVAGPRTAKVRLLGAYMARLQAAAARDPALAVAFARVMALVDPPPSLLRPGTAARVLRGGRRAAVRAGSPPATYADAATCGVDPHEEVRR